MNKGTRRFIITSLLVAICLLLGLTPVGYIPIPPIEITLLCIPVIIGTIRKGWELRKASFWRRAFCRYL